MLSRPRSSTRNKVLKTKHAEVAQALLAPGPQDEQHRGEIADGEDEEQRGERDAGLLGQGEDEAGACHESGRDHVHGGDDAGAHLRGRPGLDLREGGDDEQAAREGKAEEAGKKMPSASSRAGRPTGDRSSGERSWSSRRSAAMSRQKIAISAAPSGTSARLGCSRDALAATKEPSATPMAKTVRHRLITYSLPLKAICTRRRQERDRHEADEPEPGDDHGADPKPPIDAQARDQRKRRGQGIAGDLEVACRGARRADEERGNHKSRARPR